MSKNLKSRILTSIPLLFALIGMMASNLLLGYLLIILGIFSILEFFKINTIILKKNRIKQFCTNLLFILYIFLFCSAFLVFSFFLHLKILIFSILIICIASDIGGFVFGKLFKGTKLTKISPKKTIFGAIGSLILSSCIAALLFYYLTQNFNFYIIIIGLITSIGCQVGDLFFSYLKRKSLLKDTSNYLPGHGGILDRIDGILFGIPVGFLCLIIIYYR